MASFSSMRGLFITLEGIDGCGKSTQHTLLVESLRKRGLDPLATREPGGTGVGEDIRSMLSTYSTSLAPSTELLLIVAARAQHVEEVIRPALAAGRIVISDRYTDSTVVFQGYGRGLDLVLIDEMNRFATGGLRPDLTILFDLETGVARRRLDVRDSDSRSDSPDTEMSYFDREETAFHERVREGYLKIAAAEPERFKIVDASGAIEGSHEQVMSIVMSALKVKSAI
ncbi:MAG TPA: dTMP kinase [Blastocatellia bacterium]|nr:dTMP kinase [Blastocatellia bacterium]